VRPVVGLVRRHAAVAICKLPMDFRVKVGKCGPEDFVELSRAVPSETDSLVSPF
jgi:hypothetical protein